MPQPRIKIEMPDRYSVHQIPPDRKPDQMLFNSELDAIICTNLFPSLLNPPPHVRRLFENYEEVEAAYFKKTGIFPIMHSVALRQELWQENPWIARALVIKATITPSTSEAVLKLNEDGSLNVLTSSVELGHKAKTVLAQLAAEALQVPLSSVSVSDPDTDITPCDQQTSSSRTHYSLGY